MAAKRLGFDAQDQQKEKRKRTMPTFASVIEEVMLKKSLTSLCNTLEPLLRRVVTEEVEKGIQKRMRTLSKSPSFRIQAREPTTLKLVFTNKSLPTTFTCTKVVDIKGNPLQLCLVEQQGDQITPTTLDCSIKLEIVVINGDFPPHEQEVWTAKEFMSSVVRQRDGKRPLLVTKEASYVIRDQGYVNVEDIELTDNSSWIRCRKFRLGARVEGGSLNGVRILEALTEPFVVKDQRGELYKKHYPPMLGDDVWRLEKIGKDGKFHKRLSQENLNTVQDLLKLYNVDQTKLRKILGGKKGISEKIWESIMGHASKCEVGNKMYIYRGPSCDLILDSICQVCSITTFEGQILYHSTSHNIFSIAQKKEIDQLVKDAYENWNSLQEVDAVFPAVPQVNLIGECSNSEQNWMAYGIETGGYTMDGSQQAATIDPTLQLGNSETLLHNLL